MNRSESDDIDMTQSQRFLLNLRSQYDEQLRYGEACRRRIKEYSELAAEVSTWLDAAQPPANPGPICRTFTIPIVPYMFKDP
jgi:hypothetical protein